MKGLHSFVKTYRHCPSCEGIDPQVLSMGGCHDPASSGNTRCLMAQTHAYTSLSFFLSPPLPSNIRGLQPQPRYDNGTRQLGVEDASCYRDAALPQPTTIFSPHTLSLSLFLPLANKATVERARQIQLCVQTILSLHSLSLPRPHPRPVLSSGLASVSQSSRGRKGTESHVDSHRLGDPGSPAKLMLMWPRHVAVGSSIRNLMLPAAATYPLCSLPPFPLSLSSLPLSFSEKTRERVRRYGFLYALHTYTSASC